MSDICFDRTSFYLFVLAAVCIIVYSLWHIHYAQLKRLSTRLTSEREYFIAENQQKLLDQEQYLKQMFAQQMASDEQRFANGERMMNPFVPPVRSDSLSYMGALKTVPVNLPTRGEYGAFQQFGYLQDPTDTDKAMPLMGRKIHSNKFEYYTFHHNNTAIKIPVSIRGDQEINDGDTVKISGYTGPFTVKLYDLDYPKYIPY